MIREIHHTLRNLLECANTRGRFPVIDEEVYPVGTSLKDLGKKHFAFPKIEVMDGSGRVAGL